MSPVFNEFLAVARALFEAAQNQTDPSAAESFYRRSISTAYYALFHRLTEDVASIVLGHLETHRQVAFQRSIRHNTFKELRKQLSEQQKHADQACWLDRQRDLAELMALCADLLQLQDYRESADYAPQLCDPRTTAEEALRSSAVALQTWGTMPEGAKALFAQSLLWYFLLNQRIKPS